MPLKASVIEFAARRKKRLMMETDSSLSIRNL